MESKKENDRTYTVTEFCPHCENEIEMQWDTDRRGYKAFCPVCGKRLMLCDECRHSGPDGGPLVPCDYDYKTDTCWFNPRTVNDLRPGDDVYVIERDEEDRPVAVSGYMCIAVARGYVIVSAFVNDLETAEDTLHYLAGETQEGFGADLQVYRMVDCFLTSEDAHAALRAQGGEDDV